MSALRQKHTFRSAIAMSALPPKADIPLSGLFSLSCIKVRLVQIKTPLEMSVWANRREDTGTRRVS